jgi:hypothetical protein
MPRPACHCNDLKPGIRCDDTGCDRVRLGEPYDLSQCRPCFLWFHSAEYRRLWGGEPTELAVPHTQTCACCGERAWVENPGGVC